MPCCRLRFDVLLFPTAITGKTSLQGFEFLSVEKAVLVRVIAIKESLINSRGLVVGELSVAIEGGFVLTVQAGDQFDGIVFAELAEAKWMAGSNHFKRTNKEQEDYPREEADADTLVQMAIVYKGDQITVYRNGEEYASHKARNIDLLSNERTMCVRFV